MKIIKGVVSSAKMQKTIVVSVDFHKTHKKYKKRYKATTKYYVHDENSSAKEGDVVFIQEVAPISKTKKWTLINQGE